MKLLITGGFGYLGTRFADFLLGKGYEITLLVHSENSELLEWQKRFKVLHGDITDQESLKGCCNGIDSVLHLASLNEIDSGKYPDKALLVNSLGTRNMLEEAVTANVGRFIYMSTVHIYGADYEVVSEDTPPRPVHDYATTHLFGEHYALQFNKTKDLSVSIIRFANGYGSPVVKSINRWSLVINDLCRMAVEKKEIVLKSSGLQSRDFVSINDGASAVDILLNTPLGKVTGEVFNVGGDNALSIKEIAEIVSSEYKKHFGEELPVVAPKAKEGEKGSAITVDINKIKNLGYKPVNRISEEIRKLFDLLS